MHAKLFPGRANGSQCRNEFGVRSSRAPLSAKRNSPIAIGSVRCRADVRRY